jgi:hypothetical protein
LRGLSKAVSVASDVRERLDSNLTGAERLHANNQCDSGGSTMAKRGRKKKDRKYSKANHGKRPNS